MCHHQFYPPAAHYACCLHRAALLAYRPSMVSAGACACMLDCMHDKRRSRHIKSKMELQQCCIMHLSEDAAGNRTLQRITQGMAGCSVEPERVQRIAHQVPALVFFCALFLSLRVISCAPILHCVEENLLSAEACMQYTARFPSQSYSQRHRCILQ